MLRTTSIDDKDVVAAAAPSRAIPDHSDTDTSNNSHVDDEKGPLDHDENSDPSLPDYPDGNDGNRNAKDHGSDDIEAATLARTVTGPYSMFSKRQKQCIVAMASFAGAFSPLSANIYFPALNTLAQEFNVSKTLINLTLTTYMIMQGLAPMMIGDLADSTGRRPAYALCFLFYLGANLGLALQDSYAALLVLRMLQSAGSSATIALSSGVVADLATSAERGSYMGWVTSGQMIAPALAPVIGGILTQFLGWRAIFWFLLILAGVYIIPFFIFFPETGRNIVGNGSIPPPRYSMSLLNYLDVRKARKIEQGTTGKTVSREQMQQAQEQLAKKRKFRFPNPLGTLHVLFEKDVAMLLFLNAMIYTAFYDVIATIPFFFQQIYGFNDLQIGLCFLAYGSGAFIAALVAGKAMDWNYRRVAKKVGFAIDRKRGDDLRTFPIERARLQVAFPALMIGNTSVLVYGWVLQQEVHLAVPLILQFLMGVFLAGSFNVLSVLLVDLYPQKPATATAANNLVRCAFGAAGTAVIFEMRDAMGTGWCFAFIGLVMFAVSQILWLLTKYGPGWREERRKRMEGRAEE